MKSAATAYATTGEVSVQESVYLVLPELWLRKVFPGVVFTNSNIPEKRLHICLSEKEKKDLTEESTIIWMTVIVIDLTQLLQTVDTVY